MICKNCNFDLLPTIKNVGQHVGAYCAFCGKWIKWLDKSERTKYTNSSGDKYQTLTAKHTEKHVNVDEDDDGEVPW